MTLTSSTLLNVGSKCGCACNPVEHQPEQCSPVRYKGRFGRHWDTPLTGESASGGGRVGEGAGGGVGEGAGGGVGEGAGGGVGEGAGKGGEKRRSISTTLPELKFT